MYKVLIADDEVLDLEGMRTFIPWTELGLEVVAAVHNGFAAYDVLMEKEIDILVSDIHMPSMSGLELARKALDSGRCNDLRIVFVSGYQDFHYVKQALSLKAYSYVLKPMDDNELIKALAAITKDLNQERDRQAKEQQLRDTYMQAIQHQKKETAAIVPPLSNSGGELKKNTKLIHEMIQYMKQHMNQSLTLKEVADHFCFSPNYLGLMFKEETGKTFSEYVISLRMEKAGELLKDPKVKIYEVADLVGYRYMPYFSRQFKETFGMTPIEFRRKI
ncbi:response regulator transcription factor [Paenibacillus gorillae]|uniref:response regulator transcription factor n=1 Tax=Paenibacillus gorillae TaxID=1243662 RepID=UPI0004B0F347|nr:response regulator [Paenibacillus gorillae]